MDETVTNANLTAYGMLLIWPVVAFFLYAKLPIGRATLWTILGGYLLLPVGLGVKIPIIPIFNKDTIPSLAALLGCLFTAKRLPKFFRGFGLEEAFATLILVGPFVTSMLNGDAIRVGVTFVPGVGAYDAGSAALYQFVFILPFFLGRQFLRNPEHSRDALRVLAIAGLLYSLPILFEMRMSPQLHAWLYGYVPSSISMEFRDGSFRSRVFLANGLLLAFFVMTTAVAAAALWRTRERIARVSAAGVTAYLASILFLCKALGSFMYGAIAIPLVRRTSPRVQLSLACLLTVIALVYPILRVADVFPTEEFVHAAQTVSAERASSLNTRFVNEDQLLEHAWERPWFGWGRYGRSRVYNGYLGSDASITDGYWIIIMGQFGIIGFIGIFGLLALGVFRVAMSLKRVQTPYEAGYLSALALIVALNIADSLPNASITPWTWLLVGALVGRAESLHAAGAPRLHEERRRVLIGHPAQ